MGVEGLGVLSEQLVLQGSPAFFDEPVDPGDIGGHRLLNADWAVGEEFLCDAVGCLAHAQCAQVLVVGDHVLSQKGGQFTAAGAAQQIHLPEALRGVHVPEGKHGVAFGIRVDVRHGHVIKHHFDGGLYSVGGDVEFIVRTVGVDEGGEATDQEDHDDAQGDEDVLHDANRRGVQSTPLRAGLRQRTTSRREVAVPFPVRSWPT